MNDNKISNQSVSKILQIFFCLSNSKQPLRLIEVSDYIGMAQATTLRYLNALIEEGMVFQDEISGRYYLTWRICDIADNVKKMMTIRNISGYLLSQMSVDLQLGVCLVSVLNDECVYLDCIYEEDRLGRTLQRIGKKTPLNASGSGKVLLSGYSDIEFNKYIECNTLKKLTDKTIIDSNELISEIEKIKNIGYAIDDEECELGLRCVAVPLRDYTGNIVAAVSVFGTVDKVSFENIENDILPYLFNISEKLSFRMGYLNGDNN